MKTLKSPKSATVELDSGCSRLWFDADSAAPDGLYQMGGGIAWPMLVGGVFEGFAILAGRHVESSIIYLFSQREFSTIEHVIDEDKTMLAEGLAPWFNRNWSKFYAYRYWWFQQTEFAMTFRLRVSRCRMISPKPTLVKTHWSTDEHASLMIADIIEQDQLRFPIGSIVHEQVDQQSADPDQGPYPAVHALACLLSGFQRKSRSE